MSDQDCSGRHEDKQHGFHTFVVLAAASLVLILFRTHAFELPLEADECNYAVIAGRLLEGDRLYVDVWDHQPPGIFVIYAAATVVFGDEPFVFRGLAIGASLLSLILVFLLAKQLAGFKTSVAAAVLFAVVSSDPGTAGEGCNREVFMNVFVLCAWWLATRSRRLSSFEILLAGCALGLGSVVKTVLAVHWLLLASLLLFRMYSFERDNRWNRMVVTLALFAAGPLLIWLATFGYFTAMGRAGEFLDAAFYFNLSYSETGSPAWERFVYFFSPRRHPFVFRSAIALWVSGALTVPILLWAAFKKQERQVKLGAWAALSLVAGSYLAVCLPGQAWPHYYYLMIPPLVMATSVAAALLAAAARRRVGRLGMAVLWVIPALCLWTEYDRYLSESSFGITRSRYNSRDFWARGQGARVAGVTEPEDTIFVFGNDAGIYYYSQRRCASRYTMITGLQTGHAGAGKRRETLLEELRAARPRLILLLYDEQPFEGWREFLGEFYGPAIGVDYHDTKGEVIMAVFALRERPVDRINWDWDRSEILSAGQP